MKLAFPKLYFLFVFIGVFSFISGQYIIPNKPNVLYPVYDEIQLLTESEKYNLNQKLIAFEDSTSVEILVYIVHTIQGEDANYVAAQIGEKWGLGKKNIDNGIVFLIAKKDRKMAIQKGRDLDKYLTASVAGQILDYLVTPKFKQGLWYEGINNATTALMEAVQGKYKPTHQKKSDSDGISIFHILIILVFIIVLIIFISKSKGGNGGSFDDDEDIILSRRGRRNYPGGFFDFPIYGGSGGFGGGSSGGSGGFGGFGGGGSFGGGGASGSW